MVIDQRGPDNATSKGHYQIEKKSKNQYQIEKRVKNNGGGKRGMPRKGIIDMTFNFHKHTSTNQFDIFVLELKFFWHFIFLSYAYYLSSHLVSTTLQSFHKRETKYTRVGVGESLGSSH